MNTLGRHPAPRLRAAWHKVILAGLLAGSLSGCLMSGPVHLADSVTRPDPPPVPLRKPRPPESVLARTASVPARAAVEAVATASLGRAPVITQSLAPLRKPVAATTPGQPPAQAATPRAPAPVGRVAYRVQAGDTVYGVARRFAVPVRGVIDANALRPPYRLRIGQVLRVPNPRRHLVRAGDTVYGVAQRYGADPSQLVRLNRIAAPYDITPGQSLALPAPSRSGTGQVLAEAATAAPTGSQAPAPIQPTAVPAPPPRAGSKFIWPVQGRTIAGYGRKTDGLHNDGINIAAPRGAPVRAADSGVVAYVGNELRGFGNLILIKHAGGWVTAYAHTERFLVRRGQTVTRGQPIARVGSSGNVATPQLHFEIRKGTRSVDPHRFLGSQRAAAG